MQEVALHFRGDEAVARADQVQHFHHVAIGGKAGARREDDDGDGRRRDQRKHAIGKPLCGAGGVDDLASPLPVRVERGAGCSRGDVDGERRHVGRRCAVDGDVDEPWQRQIARQHLAAEPGFEQGGRIVEGEWCRRRDAGRRGEHGHHGVHLLLRLHLARGFDFHGERAREIVRPFARLAADGKRGAERKARKEAHGGDGEHERHTRRARCRHHAARLDEHGRERACGAALLVVKGGRLVGASDRISHGW